MARPAKDKTLRTEPRSVSLVPAHWRYLEALADEIRLERAGERDALGERATVSEAVRHLIARDLASRQKDKEGRPVFIGGPGQIRAVDMKTGATHVALQLTEALRTRAKAGKRR